MTELAHTETQPDAAPLDAGSLVWRYFGDNRMYLIGPRPAVLQNMLAELGQGVRRPFGVLCRHRRRVKRSMPPIFNTVYGSSDDNAGAASATSTSTSRATCRTAAAYHALNPETYFWAHATFVEQVLYFADTFVKRLTDAEKEQIYRDPNVVPPLRRERPGAARRLCGVRKVLGPHDGTVVVPHKTARYGVGYVAKGFPRPKAVPPLAWKIVAPAFNPVAAFLTTAGCRRGRGCCSTCRGATGRNGATGVSPRSGARAWSTRPGIDCR